MNILRLSIFVLFLVAEFGWIHASNNGIKVLEYINKKRRSHGCPPLHMDVSLNRDCKDFAKHIARTKISYSDPSDKNYTENICKFLVKSANPMNGCVENWYNGNKFKLSDSRSREFRAMIWRSSRHMGYGYAMISPTEAVMVVRFTPPGNLPGITMNNVPSKLYKKIRNKRDSDDEVKKQPVTENEGGTTKKKKDKKKKKKKRRRRRGSAVRHASLNLFTVLFISYWSVRI